jgi:hypothetical protein
MSGFLRVAALALGVLLPAVQAAASPMGQTEHAVDRPGGDYHSYQSGGVSQCSTSCGTVARCRAFTYVPSTGVCWMKDRVPPPVASACCQSGVKVMGAMEMGTDRPGADIRPGFEARTSSECERACRLDAQCLAYTFVKPGVQGPAAKCWLKNARPARVANPCCVSGVRLPPVRRLPAAGAATRTD